MASTGCKECSQAFSTSRDSYPFCSWACHRENAERKARQKGTSGDSTASATPRRPGRLSGF